jgi:hypothetical protein
MAYVSQEHKAEIAPVVKAILKKYGIKGSLAVSHHSTLVLNIKSGAIDFISNYNSTVAAQPGGFRLGSPAKDALDVNVYHIDSHFTGKARKALEELAQALRGPRYFDHSDSQTDYFHVSHYIDINVGRWNKPYQLVK